MEFLENKKLSASELKDDLHQINESFQVILVHCLNRCRIAWEKEDWDTYCVMNEIVELMKPASQFASRTFKELEGECHE